MYRKVERTEQRTFSSLNHLRISWQQELNHLLSLNALVSITHKDIFLYNHDATTKTGK